MVKLPELFESEDIAFSIIFLSIDGPLGIMSSVCLVKCNYLSLMVSHCVFNYNKYPRLLLLNSDPYLCYRKIDNFEVLTFSFFATVSVHGNLC